MFVGGVKDILDFGGCSGERSKVGKTAWGCFDGGSLARIKIFGLVCCATPSPKRVTTPIQTR